MPDLVYEKPELHDLVGTFENKVVRKVARGAIIFKPGCITGSNAPGGCMDGNHAGEGCAIGTDAGGIGHNCQSGPSPNKPT